MTYYLHAANGWWGGNSGSDNGGTVYYSYSAYSSAIDYSLGVYIAA